MNDNIIKWIWLKLAVKDRNLEAYKLYTHFGSIDKIYSLTYDEIADIDFINGDLKTALCDKKTDAAERIIRNCNSNDIEIITVDDKRYPQSLMEIHNYPCVLFAYGNFEKAFSNPLITAVGTRHCTSYGERTAAKISAVLAYSGFSIVAGVADGIDTAVIAGALSVGGSVIAVLPKGHAGVPLSASYKFKDVRKDGVLISEYLPNFKPHKYIYQERNRILAGLSLGSVIIQAPFKSGAVMTAGYALQQNRDVFSLPGNIDMPASYGTNNLLKEGAIPIITYRDIVDYYKPQLGDLINDDIPEHLLKMPAPEAAPEQDMYEFKRVAIKHMDEYEILVFNVLQTGETDIDAIKERTNMPIGNVTYALSSLETKGVIKSSPGGKYKIIL